VREFPSIVPDLIHSITIIIIIIIITLTLQEETKTSQLLHPQESIRTQSVFKMGRKPNRTYNLHPLSIPLSLSRIRVSIEARPARIQSSLTIDSLRWCSRSNALRWFSLHSLHISPQSSCTTFITAWMWASRPLARHARSPRELASLPAVCYLWHPHCTSPEFVTASPLLQSLQDSSSFLRCTKHESRTRQSHRFILTGN
jgi:hypothetical protein